MYVNIWSRKGAVHNLDLLLDKQEQDILRSFPDAKVFVTAFVDRKPYATLLRRAEIPNYPTAELTAFVELPFGIFFVVLFSPLLVQRRNLRKLEYIMRSAVFADVRRPPLIQGQA